jgi:dolichol-phosphate mannosyltransferase
MSGLYFAEGDYFAVIAADLQEPPEVIAQMLKISSEGYRIVLGERKNIDNPFFAKITSRIFHAIMRALIFRKAPAKGFDFFMIDNVVRETILRMFERNTNLLYLLIWTGYPYALVEYNKSRRKFGKSQWTLRKKIDLFFDTLFAFTLLPLRLLGAVGLLFLPTGLGLLGFEFSRGNFHHAALTNGLLLFLAGSILLGINILGEYLWRVTAEVKGRPIFLVNEYFEKKEEEPKRGKLGFFSDRKNEDTKESQS